MRLNPTFLDELRARVTLSGVIGRTTRLTKAGREFKACCPFHNEKTPSFTVNDEKGFYHCFGCGAHGDVFRWMTDQRGLAFMDAVKELAAEAGMEVPAPDPRAAQAAEKRDTLHDVMQAAQDWFVANLHESGGQVARDYLQKRGISPHTAEVFGFGYAPEDRQAMKAALSRFPEAMLIEAGLRIAVEDRDPYDRFRGRLMLPIRDARGRVIAFGGRILDSGKTDAPKYLNSPDTPLFDKGRTLYNLNRAAPAARKTGQLIVVEGYMDVVALAAAGVEECVAPMGTALTEQQIELLWRQVESPVLCFDGDAAGQRAAMRAIGRALPMLRPAHSLRIVTLPQGLDPDDLVKRDGARAMEELLAGSRSLIETLWKAERDAVPLATPEDKAGLKARLLAHVDTIADQDIRSLYRRDLLDQYSAFAFPRREARDTYQRGVPLPARPSPRNAERLRRSSQGGARDALSAAVLAGLVRWPDQIARHADALARTPGLDPRFGLLLDCCEEPGMLEKADLPTILAENGMPAPQSGEYAQMRFGFLGNEISSEEAASDLAQAVGLLVERPALETALAEATARFEQELSDETYAEQQRLLKRKLEFEKRLVQMAGRRATAEQAM
ncbi:MAG: DNA primase [Novosphingobium sp.]|nr:DNA primase [Novosphingobium sp.]